MSSKKFQKLFLFVQLATVAVFLGRAWQHIIWDAPYRTLLWDEDWMSGILPWLSSMTYEEFITSVDMDDRIQSWIKGTGWFYLLCAIVAIFIRRIPKILSHLLWLGGLSLVFLAFLYCKEKFFQWGQFWEYSLQFGAPFFLFYLWKEQKANERFIFVIKVAIAITFISHGLYALNYYPRPGNFTQMVIDIFGVSEQTAIYFLNLAGILDFVVAIGIFFKGRIGQISLVYVIIWGFATTLARIWAHFSFDFMEDSLTLWMHESIYRGPHFLIPLGVFFFKKE